METLLFWVLPVAMTLTGIKSGIMTAWRMCFSALVAFYIGVWAAPAWWGLLDFLPQEADPYRHAFAVLVSVGALFAILYRCTMVISPTSHDEFWSFPKPAERVLNLFFRFVFGIVLSTLVFVLCCATPLKMMIRNNGDGMQALAGKALLKITALADRMTASTPETPRDDLLKSMELWYVPPPPPPPSEDDDDDDKPQSGKAPMPITAPMPTTAPKTAPETTTASTSSSGRVVPIKLPGVVTNGRKTLD